VSALIEKRALERASITDVFNPMICQAQRRQLRRNGQIHRHYKLLTETSLDRMMLVRLGLPKVQHEPFLSWAKHLPLPLYRQSSITSIDPQSISQLSHARNNGTRPNNETFIFYASNPGISSQSQIPKKRQSCIHNPPLPTFILPSHPPSSLTLNGL
jgi:hypothetical protein